MDNAAKTLYIGKYEPKKRFETRAFPNPVSTGILRFDCYTHYNDAVLIRVYDAMGRFVQDIKFEPEFNGKNTFEWQYESLPRGVYVYEVLFNGQRESSGRIVVAK